MYRTEMLKKDVLEDEHPKVQLSHHEDIDSEAPLAIADHISYGPTGIKGLLQSPYVFGAALLASLGGFSFGYDQGVISVINVMSQFHTRYPNTDPNHKASGFYTGFMTAMMELGAFLGCFFMPKLADTISRKWALTFVVVIFDIGAIIQTAATNYGMLVAGRFIGGIGVGTLAMGAPLYISEIAPPNLRGSLLVLEAMSVVVGVVISYWITFGTRYLDGEVSFRLPFGLQMVCSTLLGVAIHIFPYSPRWLCLVGRKQDALRSLAKLRRLPESDNRIQTEWRGIMTEVEYQKILLEKHYPGKRGLTLELLTWLDLFKKKTWRRTVVGCGVGFFQQFSGINAFIYYAPILFTSMGLSDDLSKIVSGALNVGQLVATASCFFIIDHVGRRPLAILGGIGSMVPYIIMAVLFGMYSDDWPAHRAAGWGCVAMAFVYIFAYGSTYAPLGWTLPAEIFTNATRSKGVALSTATIWLCNFIIGVATPPMIDSAGFGTFVFFACFCGLAAIWAYFLVPETKGRSLEELVKIFDDDTGPEDAEIIGQAVAKVNWDTHDMQSV